MFFLNASAMLIIGESQAFFHEDIFEELNLMHEFSNRMHELSMKRFEKMRKQTEQKPTLEISFEQAKDQSLTIKVAGFDSEDEAINADLNEKGNKWTIATNTGKIVFEEARNGLVVKTSQEAKNEQEKDNTIMYHYFSGSNQTYIPLKSAIDFAQARFEYDKQEKILQVDVPYVNRVATKVPVVIKNQANQEK